MVFPDFSGLKRLLREERCQSEWNSVYMLIVFIIAAILIIALVKPMFKQSQDIVKEQPVIKESAKP
ncbi:Uncharacterised protein [uncultured archaeon]|nr:Uncharacterised protein [uncultured archaeon]